MFDLKWKSYIFTRQGFTIHSAIDPLSQALCKPLVSEHDAVWYMQWAEKLLNTCQTINKEKSILWKCIYIYDHGPSVGLYTQTKDDSLRIFEGPWNSKWASLIGLFTDKPAKFYDHLPQFLCCYGIHYF